MVSVHERARACAAYTTYKRGVGLGIGGAFRKLADKYRRFLYGRYGHDSLNRFIYFFSIALCILSFFVRSNFFFIAILMLFAITLYRSLSKNFAKRRRENQLFEKAAKPVKRHFKYWYIRFTSKKTHRVFTCVKCKSILRIPKAAGHGKIEIKCPKCGASFISR